ncbi:hypothetical protein [Nonomuraea dietziae]|uniref:Uncharacterized protein n=1 Tax=Nonomuraea dietziae TaxID=65515 RepID=A0A7W5VT64_9ACTN|nr:hypothetical protein [Nonomuraea dietziae]MBB3734057.1 hypothetical protein [Nonomuraea dietziae]
MSIPPEITAEEVLAIATTLSRLTDADVDTSPLARLDEISEDEAVKVIDDIFCEILYDGLDG